MGHQHVERKTIALEQLEVALRVWEEGSQFFAVITLAGAAEEILGMCLRMNGVDNSIESLEKSVAAMYRSLYDEEIDSRWVRRRANYVRNQSKHYDLSQAPRISVDAKEEARDLLNRAIDNYWRLESSLTPAMRKFDESQRDFRPGIEQIDDVI